MKKKIMYGAVIAAIALVVVLVPIKDGKTLIGINYDRNISIEASSVVNYENFDRIHMGDKYSDIVKFMGEGKEEISSEYNGVKSVGYSWSIEGKGYIKVIADGGLITTKSQSSLKGEVSNVTLDKYNQLKKDMTYSNVEEILGKGQMAFQNKYAGFETVMYKWINEDGSSINITFSNDSLTEMSQTNLK